MIVPGRSSPEVDPAARWLAHYEAVEERRRVRAPFVRGLRPRWPGPRRRRKMIGAFVALSIVLVGAALAVLWPS